VDTRFRSSDWFIALGGLLVLIGSLLPWWTMRFDGALAVSQNGYDFGLTGRVPIAIMLVVAIMTVIVKTESLALPAWLVHPYAVAVAVGVAAIGIGVRFVWSGYENAGRVSRGIGLYLAAAGVVVAVIGCVLAIRDLRRPVEDIPAADEDDLDDDDDENDDDPYAYGYAGDEEDVLRHLDAAPPAAAGPAGRAPASPTPPPRRTATPREPVRRRPPADRVTAPATRRRRRQPGPPLP
jgi:hypothetical protein